MTFSFPSRSRASKSHTTGPDRWLFWSVRLSDAQPWILLSNQTNPALHTLSLDVPRSSQPQSKTSTTASSVHLPLLPSHPPACAPADYCDEQRASPIRGIPPPIAHAFPASPLPARANTTSHRDTDIFLHRHVLLPGTAVPSEQLRPAAAAAPERLWCPASARIPTTAELRCAVSVQRHTTRLPLADSTSPPQQGYGYQSPQPPYQNYGQPTPPPQQYGYNQVSSANCQEACVSCRGGLTYAQAPPQQQYGNYGPPQQAPRPGKDMSCDWGDSELTLLPGMPTVNSNQWTHGNTHAPPPPPSGAQNFGHGAPQGYSFQYSACNGRRKALLIGINYFGQRGQLRGCINDVKNMSTYLNEFFGYKREDMVTLTDDQQNPMSQPTKANILRAMHWLVKDARPNDSLFFHYSGTLQHQTAKPATSELEHGVSIC